MLAPVTLRSLPQDSEASTVNVSPLNITAVHSAVGFDGHAVV